MMTRDEIKQAMIKSIAAAIESAIEDINEYIDEDDIQEFMWGVDYGQAHVDLYIDDKKADLIESYLKEIYDEIDTDDIAEEVSPF